MEIDDDNDDEEEDNEENKNNDGNSAKRDESDLDILTCIKNVTFTCQGQGQQGLIKVTHPPYIMEKWHVGMETNQEVECIVNFEVKHFIGPIIYIDYFDFHAVNQRFWKPFNRRIIFYITYALYLSVF